MQAVVLDCAARCLNPTQTQCWDSFIKRIAGGYKRRGEHYSQLVHAEITEYLQQTVNEFDLIISADTLVNFGDLTNVVKASADCLISNG